MDEIKDYIQQNNKCPITNLKHYQIIKLLGKGSFGKVFLGLHKLTNRLCAIKCIKKSQFKDEKKKKLLQEVKILKRFLGHPNIIKILEVFENEKFIFFVMEFAANGDLLNYLKQKKIFDEQEAKRLFFQICVGLRFIHSEQIIHRDIKLDNILLDNNFKCKICDFGVSRIMPKDEYIKEQCGTPAYLAPEIIQDMGYKNFSADIWSLGVLLFSLVTGNMPFKASSLEVLQQKILKGDFEIPKNLKISENLKDILNLMLEINPYKRIKIDDILQHKWLQEINLNTLTMEDVRNFEKKQKNHLVDFEFKINDFVLSQVMDLGFSKEMIIDSIQNKKMDMISCCYYNIEKDFVQFNFTFI